MISRQRLTLASLVVILTFTGAMAIMALPSPRAAGLRAPLEAALSPYVQQKWNMFAPEITTLSVRLRVEARFDGEPLPWLDVTRELQHRTHERDPFPPRVAKQSSRLASSYDAAVRRAGASARRFAQAEQDARGITAAYRALLTEGVERGAASNYYHQERALLEYLTYMTRACFGRAPRALRWQVVMEPVVPFDEPAQKRKKTYTFTTGPRAPFEGIDLEALGHYERYVAGAERCAR